MQINGKVTISKTSDDVIRIAFKDYDASVTFAVAEISLESFAGAITGLAFVDAKIFTNGLEYVGKVKEAKEVTFQIASGHNKDAAKLELQKHIPEGWGSNETFSSQSSFFSKDGKDYARAIIQRWVDKPL